MNKLRWLFNMFIVWLLTGLWHGAAWNFILWGLYYFILLVLEKTLFKNIIKKPVAKGLLNYIITFVLINIGWMLFRVNRIQDLLAIINHTSSIGLVKFISSNSNVILGILLLPVAYFLSLNIMKKIDYKFKEKWLYNGIKKVTLLFIFVLSISFLVSSMYNPFIYFRF